MGTEEAIKLLFGKEFENLSEKFNDPDKEHSTDTKWFFVILEVVLKNGVMDEEILLRPNDDYSVDNDPRYDIENGLLTVTIKDRYDSLHIKNYMLHDIFFEVEEGTGLIKIKDLSLDEVVINSSVTGGK